MLAKMCRKPRSPEFQPNAEEVHVDCNLPKFIINKIACLVENGKLFPALLWLSGFLSPRSMKWSPLTDQGVPGSIHATLRPIHLQLPPFAASPDCIYLHDRGE